MNSSDSTEFNMRIENVKQLNGSIGNGADINGAFSKRSVDVLIYRVDTDTLIAKYTIPLINEREASHLNSWLNEAWTFAIADGIATDAERLDYRLELHGNLSVNEAIDRAQELNGMNVCVRGRLVLDFEHEALIHLPKNEYRDRLPPSNATGHHRLNGSEIWLNLSTLGLTRSELSPRVGIWVSVFGTLHAVAPPDMRNRWYSRMLNWWKYGSAEPHVGLGHFGGFPVAIDVLEITDLQPLTAIETEAVDKTIVKTKKKVIRGSNVTERIIRPRESGKSDDFTATRSVRHNDSNLVNEISAKSWFEKIQSPGSGTLWFVISLLFLIIIGKTF